MKQDVVARGGVTKPRVSLAKGLRDFVVAKPLGAAGGILLLLMIVVAVIAPWLTQYDPVDTNITQRLLPPSSAHWLGTDALGRDVFSRIVYGAQISVIVGFAAVLIGTVGGALLGVASGYLGGRFDMVIQRLMDILMAFPGLILAIVIMAVMGGSLFNVILAISIPALPTANRVIRSVAVSVKEFTFVEAARSVGAGQWRILWHHILPNCLAALLIVATARLGVAILTEASLSFLGLGVPPPAPSLGRSLSEAVPFVYRAPWLAIYPGIAISILVFGINMLGDALRDIWDPRLKRM